MSANVDYAAMNGEALAGVARIAIMRALTAESSLAAANTELAKERAAHAVTADRLNIILHHLESEIEHKHSHSAIILEACLLVMHADAFPKVIVGRGSSHAATQRAIKAFLKVAPAKIPPGHHCFGFMQTLQTTPQFGPQWSRPRRSVAAAPAPRRFRLCA